VTVEFKIYFHFTGRLWSSDPPTFLHGSTPVRRAIATATCMRFSAGGRMAALTAKHDTLVRRAPCQPGHYASILPVYQQRDWGPGMVKCVGPTRCSMRPCWVAAGATYRQLIAGAQPLKRGQRHAENRVTTLKTNFFTLRA